MVDHVSTAKRSEIMRSVRSKNTRPEMVVRRAAHSLGLRFRLFRKDLPGCPDLVFPRWKTVIFVHGCFWHRHDGCSKATVPKTNAGFWLSKFDANVHRDLENEKKLQKLGWRVFVIWQCQVPTTERACELLGRIFELDAR